ncbi:MAG: hypothetical protein UHD09_09260 [Bifidobacterium sp.]|nr:hypothetical protein [Bifidobacterium sp.]
MDVRRWQELAATRTRICRWDSRPGDEQVRDEMVKLVLADLDGALEYFTHPMTRSETVWLFEILGTLIERTQDPRIVPSVEQGLEAMGLPAYEQGLYNDLRDIVARHGDKTLKSQVGIEPPAPASRSNAAPSRPDGPLPEWVWAMVANVVDERTTGEDHHVVHGTKGFSPGTKVYVADDWHMSLHDCGGYLQVIGRPRHGRRLVRMWVRRDALMNFRVQQCRQPQAIKLMNDGYLPMWGGPGDGDRNRLRKDAAYYRQDEIAERQARAERDGSLSVTPRSLKRVREQVASDNDTTPKRNG